MLAIFKNGVVDAPTELHSPADIKGSANVKSPEDTLKEFLSAHPNDGLSIGFVDKALLAFAPSQGLEQRYFCGVDNIYTLFLGSLNNLCSLNRQYALSKGANEAMFVTEAYRTLRDRGPYPAHQVLKDLDGSFSFVIYDHKAGTVFAALGADERLKLFWGIAADGSVMISDNVELIKASCAKSFAPFPAGCMYHSSQGLTSFEHPMNKMKAFPRVDSEGVMCGANFKVDKYARIHSMPRVGSEANWATWGQEA